jgi:hypothetical protein
VNKGMTAGSPILALLTRVSRVGAELLLFAVVLLGLGKSSEYADLPVWGWQGLVILACVWFAVGAIPLPWPRTAVAVGTASFLVPFAVLGVVYWAFERMPIVPSWSAFPRVLLGPANVGRALLASAAALSGQALTARASRWAGRRTTRCS